MQIYKKILEQKYDESHYFYNKVLNKNLSEKFFAPLPSPTVNLSLTAPKAEHSERCHCKAHTAVKHNYLEVYDKSSTDLNSEQNLLDNYVSIFQLKKENKEKIPSCCIGFMSFICPCCGKKYFKSLLCGKEWCPECGADGSWVHKRRQARWWDKVMQMDKLGYLVVTTSLEVRQYIMHQNPTESKKILNAIRKYWVRKLKREFRTRGVVRWHWAGSDGTTFAPHLNILFEHGFINKKTLNTWRTEFQKWFKTTYKIKTKVVINYSFGNTKIFKIHQLKYVTRSTMRTLPSEQIQHILFNYHNSVVFGKFDADFRDSDVPRQLTALEHGKCPDCNVALDCTGFVSYIEFCLYDRTHLSAGWFVDTC